MAEQHSSNQQQIASVKLQQLLPQIPIPSAVNTSGFMPASNPLLKQHSPRTGAMINQSQIQTSQSPMESHRSNKIGSNAVIANNSSGSNPAEQLTAFGSQGPNMLAANQQYMTKVQQQSNTLFGKQSQQQQSQQNGQSQQQSQGVKNGRIGIFGNYLASRISSIQQQKFLLQAAPGGNSSASGQTTTGDNTSRKYQATSRNSTHRPPPQYQGQPTQEMAAASIVEFQFQGAVLDGENQQKRNRSSNVTGGGNKQSSMSREQASLAGKSPFANSAKAKPIKQRKIALMPDEDVYNDPKGSIYEHQQQMLPKKIQNAGQREYARRHGDVVPDLVIDPRQSFEIVAGFQTGEQRPGVGTEISNKASSKQKYQIKTSNTTNAAVNKSYQGGLTKLLKQVYNHELEQQQQQRTPNLQNASKKATDKNSSGLSSIKQPQKFQEPPTFFSSGTFGEEQFSTWDNTKKGYPQMVGTKTSHSQPPYASTNMQQSDGLTVNQKYHSKQPSQLSSAMENDFTVSGQKQKGSHMVQNIRSHSQTPHQDSMLANANEEGNISPMQVRKGTMVQGAYNQKSDGGSNSISAVLVHRSFDQQVDMAIDKMQEAKNIKQQQQPPRIDRQLVNPLTIAMKPLNTQAAAIAFQNSAGSVAQFMDSSRHNGLAGKSHREELIQRGTTKQYLNSANLPLNSKLNAALRTNGKLGLGPCLEERQMGMIDKIWGNFNSEYEESGSKKHLVVASARMSGNESSKNSQPVQLVDPTKKRKRNELSYAQSGGVMLQSSGIGKQIKIEDIPPTVVFLQQSETSNNTNGSQVRHGGPMANRMLSTDDRQHYFTQEDSTPVWLPKKTIINRNTVAGGAPMAGAAALPGESINGRRSQNIDETALAMKRQEEESFDYKDFNFIVGKQKGSQLTSTQPSKVSRSNSPLNARNSRYAAEQAQKNQALSENYHRMKQYGQKRLSSEVLTSSQIPLTKNPKNPTSHAASIKIQIEDSKKQQQQLLERATNPEAYMSTQQATALFRSSQTNLYKMDQTQNQNAYLSLSQKKKNQQYWNVMNARPLPKDELKNLYHVTIQIDPTVPNPPSNRQSPNLVEPPNPNSPSVLYQHQYNIVKQGVLPQKQAVLHGIPGHYHVNSNPFEANPQFYEPGSTTRNGAQISASQNRNAPGMLSPRSVERKALVFSPEPKLIELLADEHMRMKTIPVMYPIIPKRQMPPPDKRMGRGASGLAGEDPTVALEGCLMHSNRGDPTAPDGFQQQDSSTDQKDSSAADNSASKKSSGYGRQPYFCPYARERMAKQKAERERRAEERQKTLASASGAAAAKEEDSKKDQPQSSTVTEESKAAELKTKEQQAEDLKNHQKELMRKFLSKFPPKKLPNLHAELEEERQRFVQARKEANKKYTEISANNNKPGKGGPLKFVIFEGNNSNIIRRVMQSRLACNMPELSEAPGSPTKVARGDQTTTASEGENNFAASNDKQSMLNYTTWQETNAPHLFNFKWKPTSNNINFERLGKFGYRQLVNHIDGHQALTTKDQLFFNMKAYCEKKNLDVYDMIPLTFAVDFQDHNYSIKFDQILQVISIFEKYISLSPTELNNKLQFAQSAFDKVIRSPLSVGPSEHQGKNLWLLKPTGFNRGIGIHVFNSIEDLQNILWTHYRIQVSVPSHYRNTSPTPEVGDGAAKDFSQRDKEIQKLSNQIAQDEQNADPEQKQAAGAGVKEIKNSSFIVQKYIEAPLLFRRRKFDIRIWALINHDAKFYLFKEAYVRTSSEEYDLSGEKLDQVYVHLTNNAVQKYSKNYGKFEEGNIVSVKALSEELASQDQFSSSLSADQIEKSLYSQMREQIEHSYEAIRSKLKFCKHSFELVGYDFMVVPVINEDGADGSSGQCEFKTKLIEANTNPCLEESNQLLKDLIPRMLDDMLKIVLDPLFGTNLVPAEQDASVTESGLPVILNYPIEGYEDNESMFNLIASPTITPQQLQAQQ